jgi:hypothetical protein
MRVEMIGLPGAGKTTIRNAIRLPVEGKGAVPLRALRWDAHFLSAAWNILALAAKTRPFSGRRLTRAFNAAVLLRHYQPTAKVIVLDQGIVQKLWSILADAESYPEERLAACLSALVPFAPDHLVWVQTPLHTAVDRIVARSAGNSRYDRRPPGEIKDALAQRAALLRAIANGYAKACARTITELDGAAEPGANAARIELLL